MWSYKLPANLPIMHLSQHNMALGSKGPAKPQLIQLIDQLAKGLSLGRQTDLILPDLSKAFGKVSHTKLLFKLY